MPGVLIRREGAQTQMHREQGHVKLEADGSDAATGQEMPGATKSWRGQGGTLP